MVLVLVLAGALIGCSGSRDNMNTGGTNTTAANNAVKSDDSNNTAVSDKYPQPVAEEFLKACEGAGSKREFCQCVFEKVQQKYTFEEFSVIESEITAGQPPKDFVEFSGKARAECAK